MKAHYVLAALVMLGITCSAQNTIDKQGRKQGHWIKTDKNGAKIYEGNFKDNKETGTFEYFYPDGTLRMRNTYVVDGEVCKHEAYDEHGRLLATGSYNKQNRDGRWLFYTESGKLIKIANYKMGIKEGQHIVFNSVGDTAELTTYVDNHRSGRWWKRIGLKGYITGTYQKGGLEGQLVEYDENGKLVRKGNYHNGVKHGNYYYYEDGVLTIEEHWNDGTLMDRLVRVLTPKEQFLSIYNLAILMPKGSAKTIIILKNGTKLVADEAPEAIYERLGNELFSLANKKGRVMVATSCINGLKKDADDRDILDIDPNPDFAIFPDEDCMKMVTSRLHDIRGEHVGD